MSSQPAFDAVARIVSSMSSMNVDSRFRDASESIRALSERFPAETTVYAGHGQPTTLGVELDRNPFLAPLRAS
jgi:glyoxylase-like metal-dependent hydrolase (beta-lactamase superfamily II)